tara:strand:- start:40 stop:645 length:606 start_codon:yes stop_codon:yes gene_type:complete
MEFKLFKDKELNVIEDMFGLRKFCLNNLHLFKAHQNGEVATNQHATNIKMIQDKYDVVFPYGYCFPLSQFIFYYLGGYESKYQLNCIKAMPITINGYTFKTSHWYVSDKTNGDIYDMTKDQFDKIIDITKKYKLGVRANYGFKWFVKINGQIKKRYPFVVPCSQAMIIYEEFRKDHPKSDHLEYLYKEFKQQQKLKQDAKI